MNYNNYYEYKNQVIAEMKLLSKQGYEMKDAIKFAESGKANGLIQECWGNNTPISKVTEHIWHWGSLA